MRAGLTLSTDGRVHVEDVELLEGGPGDVVVRVTASGVCRSDLSFASGYLGDIGPTVLGHEGVGVVEQVGREVRGLAVGDRVIASGIAACGTCWYCHHDESHLCTTQPRAPRVRRADGSTAGAITGLGTFAEYMTVHQSSLIRTNSALADEQLALIGCCVSTGVGAVLNTARVSPGSLVAVIGCGGVGQAVVQGAAIAGAARIIAVDPIALKREKALQLGASHAIDIGEDGGLAAVRELTDGRGADFVFDVVGTSETAAAALRMTRRGGLVTMVGMPRRGDELRLPAFDLLMNEKRISGSVYGSTQVRRDFSRYVALAERGSLNLSALVSQRLSLDDLSTAFRDIERGSVLRSIVVFSPSIA